MTTTHRDYLHLDLVFLHPIVFVPLGEEISQRILEYLTAPSFEWMSVDQGPPPPHTLLLPTINHQPSILPSSQGSFFASAL